MKQLFRANVPDEFLFDWVALLRQMYMESFTTVYGEHKPPEAHDLVGHTRRALIERHFRSLARDQIVMTADTFLNAQKTQYFTEARAGNIVMTQSCLRFLGQTPRHADFRAEYARTRQHTFDEIIPDEVLEEGAVFAILVHGPMPNNWRVPAFAYAAFPSDDCRRWVGQIELLHAFSPQVVTQGAAPEIIEDQANPNLLPQKEEREEEDGTGT